MYALFCRLFPEFEIVAHVTHEFNVKLDQVRIQAPDESKKSIIWISTPDKQRIPKEVDVIIWLKNGMGEDLSVVETQHVNQFVFFTFADQMPLPRRDYLQVQLNAKSFMMSAKTGEGVKEAFQQVIAYLHEPHLYPRYPRPPPHVKQEGQLIHGFAYARHDILPTLTALSRVGYEFMDRTFHQMVFRCYFLEDPLDATCKSIEQIILE